MQLQRGAAARIFPALLNGASVHPLDIKVEGVGDLPDWFIREQITISNGRRLLRDCTPALTGEDQFPHLRLVTFGGEPVYLRDVELYKQYLAPHCLMLINLATTETGSDRHYFIDKQTEITAPFPPVGYATDGSGLYCSTRTAGKSSPMRSVRLPSRARISRWGTGVSRS